MVARDSRTLVPPRRRMESVERHDAASGQHHHHRRACHGIHVAHGQRRDQSLGGGAHLAEAADFAYQVPALQEVLVRSARSPWACPWCPRCRAARIRSRCPEPRWRGGCALLDSSAREIRRRCDRSPDRPPCAARLKSSSARGWHHGHCDLGMADQVFELGAAPFGVHGYDRHAQCIQRQPVEEKRRAGSRASAPTRCPWPRPALRVALPSAARLRLAASA